ncbi:MAG: nitroreductase family protein [Proteobacteria bacterium]|nr:nitroreductase family protein [Pseudomonadota bacterium]MBU1641273.1 nitroreductase family protein [Pseudomonadota bacterium]
MDVITAIETRRAVKHYDPNHRMTEEEIDRIMSLAMLSPTAFNIQNWRFVVVKNPDLRQKIRPVAWGQAQVTDASLLVILCADLGSWQKEPGRYWQNAPKEVQDFLLPAIDAYYRDKPLVQRDEAMRSCGMAAQTLMLSAKSLGYESCPMDGFDFAEVGKLINLPADHVIAMFVVIGKGIKEPWPRGGQIGKNEAVIIDSF